MTKISIHGFYGMGNLGDEAILTAILQEFRKLSNIKVVVFTREPKQTSKIHKVKAVSSVGMGSFLRRIWEIKTSGLFVLGGGGLLKDYGSDSCSLEEWLKLIRLAQSFHVKTTVCCVGVENIRYDYSRKLIRNTLNKVDLIIVRDSESKQTLIDIGVTNQVHVGTDPAILLARIPQRKLNYKTPRTIVIISVRHWFDKGFYIEKADVNEKFIRSLGTAADFLIKDYLADIHFIPLRITPYDDDRIVAERVLSYMKYKNNVRLYSQPPSTQQFIDIAKSSSLVIGMRLHSLILSTSVGVPAIGLEYMRKVREYMKDINQVEYSISLEKVTSDLLISKIESIFANHNIISEEIRTKIAILQNIARKNLRAIVGIALRK